MISMNWVKDYVDLKDVDLNELATKITNAGVNVEKVVNNNIDHLVIGEILEAENLPGSDHLHICRVDTGDDIRQIVCGAPNARKGIKVIVSLPGAKLPNGITIEKSKIMGVESAGMLCALSELGLEEETPENRAKGIFEVPDSVKTGTNACTYLGLDDTIYELDLNPNRNIDCTNHIGFAYEVASVLGKKVKLPDTSYKEIDDNVENHFKIEVETPNCDLYLAKMVTGVKIKESPDFIKNRLQAAGMRSINNVVDISNYVMLEYGQPLHFFDKDKLGDKILVRMAGDNESITTLDGKERNLTSEDIVITDGNKPVCIAGVMGGENTEIDDDTKNILIECAVFNSYCVRYTSIRLDLRSEASLRYERGLNREYSFEAMERACHLLEKYADAKILSGKLQIDSDVKSRKIAKVTLEDINKTLGLEMKDSDVKNSLNNLGFPFTLKNKVYTVEIPNRRLDVEPHKQDIIEEVGRLYGYDKIVSKLPTLPTRSGKYVGLVSLRKKVSKRLRSLGLDEARTYTLISEEESKLFNYNFGEPIEVLKPMSSDKKVLRQSIISSLMKAYEYNKARGVKDVLLYEIANTYKDTDKEETKIAILMHGKYLSNSWNSDNIDVDFYALKGVVESLISYLGLMNRYNIYEKEVPEMHPYMTAEITIDKDPIGFLGKVHPNVSKDDLFVAELSLSKLYDKKVRPLKYKEISKYPVVNKDLAFIVPDYIRSKDIENTIKKTSKLITNVEVFDLYKGENVDSDKKSLAYTITFSDMNKTLNDNEVMEIFNKIIKDVTNEFNAVLRDK